MVKHTAGMYRCLSSISRNTKREKEERGGREMCKGVDKRRGGKRREEGTGWLGEEREDEGEKVKGRRAQE